MIDTANTNLDLFREQTHTWLEANCPQSMREPVKNGFEDIFGGGRNAVFKSEDQRIWFELMRDKGWTAPTWPKAYGGGGLSNAEAKVLAEEMAKLGCRAPLWSFGLMMLGPAILYFGTEEQKQKYIREICRGEIWWCQGYSEPGAGSDLASLQTSAQDMGDHYLVNGQKVWTSYADKADMIFCLVRTNPEASKHMGVSFLLIDMASEGVSVRPIKLISGKSPFCETFFDNVKVPKENIVGRVNEGWTIAKNLLTHERSTVGNIFGSFAPLDAFAIEAVGLDNGKLADPVLRTEVARLMINAYGLKYAIDQTIDETKAGHQPGAKSSFFKYYGTELNKDRYELMLALKGFEGLTWGETYDEGKLARDMCRTKGNSIEGGTTEVQLNIIAKHVLGLPTK
ncbi:MAG: acyl-CoA dehydrogenase family protein [Saprospiraceae bacterium]